MKGTEQRTSRDKDRTRRAILDAAEQLLSERGGGVSIAEISTAAKVSKSGLLHHFPNRDALFLAIVKDEVARLWDEVAAHIDLSENRPGKFLRGYVRALTGGSSVAMRVFAPSALATALGRSEEIEAVFARDAGAWRKAFDADGIEPARSLVIRHAAEGLAAVAGSPYLTTEELTAARAHLLALSEPDAEIPDRHFYSSARRRK
ncbi:TetR/AcrR family transcriptional regulator [Amycolatopsis lurida]